MRPVLEEFRTSRGERLERVAGFGVVRESGLELLAAEALTDRSAIRASWRSRKFSSEVWNHRSVSGIHRLRGSGSPVTSRSQSDCRRGAALFERRCRFDLYALDSASASWRRCRVRLLRGELDRRRELGAACHDEPLVVLLVDGFSALRAEYDQPALQWVPDELARVVSGGPSLGMFTVITADRAGAVSTALSSTVSQKWLFRLPDPYDYAMFGVKLRSPVVLPPGRCVVAEGSQLVQVAGRRRRWLGRPRGSPPRLVLCRLDLPLGWGPCRRRWAPRRWAQPWT